MKPGEQYGPVGSRILFENDLVRVWEISLEHRSSRVGYVTRLLMQKTQTRVRVPGSKGIAHFYLLW
jgi:hypothetical protein